MPDYEITIVGGGVIGCAIAHELCSIEGLEGRIALIERNPNIPGENQSSRNSEVIHAGIYYPQDEMPLKAQLCVEGNRMLYEFCEKHGIPYKKTGKLVVATNAMEEEYLDYVLKIAEENNVPGVKRISGEEAKDMEPNVNAVSALYVPTSGIIDAGGLVSKLYNLARAKGVHFALGNKVTRIKPKNSSFIVTYEANGKAESIETEILINAAGLYSDEIARMVNPESPYKINPIRGESAKFDKNRANLSVGMNVYPVPRGYYPDGTIFDGPYAEFQEKFAKGELSITVGIHLTPKINIVDGEFVIGKTVTLGPAYVGNIGREDYKQTWSENHYWSKVNPFFQNLTLDDISLHQVGINANLMCNSKPILDFIIEKDSRYPNFINLMGINSPGLTSSLAIAKHVRGLIAQAK